MPQAIRVNRTSLTYRFKAWMTNCQITNAITLFVFGISITMFLNALTYLI